MNDHKLILRALDVLDSMSGLGEELQTIAGDVSKILDFLRWFADAHHQTKEERILFPALKNAVASQGRSLEHMVLEHSQERALVEDIEKDLRLAQLSGFVAAANRLSSTLRNHIYKEDRILFATADAVMTTQEDETVFEQLNKFDTALDKQLLDEKLKELKSLEWQYLRK